MSTKELEELINTLRQFVMHARSQNDAFEYCRLCDELRMAEAALKELDVNLLPTISKTKPRPVFV